MRRYPKEVQDFIVNNVAGTPAKELVRIVNQEFDLAFTETKMRSYMKNHNLRSGTTGGNPKGFSRLFPKKIQDYIVENVGGTPTNDLAIRVNKEFNTNYTRQQIKSYMSNHGLQNKVDCCFVKGHIPFNKGKKMPSEVYDKCKQTMFKKGNMPVNHRPVGSERLNVDGYYEMKVAEPNVWRLKHRVIWEEVHGLIPKGYVVIFLDGNSLHCELNNLMMVSMKVNVRINQINLRFPDKELTKTGVATAKLMCKIGEARKR